MRSDGSSRGHGPSSNAARAIATARSTSCGPAAAGRAMTASVCGDTTSSTSSVLGGDHRPPMNNPCCSVTPDPLVPGRCGAAAPCEARFSLVGMHVTLGQEDRSLFVEPGGLHMRIGVMVGPERGRYSTKVERMLADVRWAEDA